MSLVAAIRLDESSTGWAISFDNTVNGIQSGIFDRLYSLRNSSAVLVAPDGKTLSAFGHDAEIRYAELRDVNAHKEYYYFTDILLKLKEYYDNTRNTTETVMLQDDTGKTLSAITTISMVIRHLAGEIKTKIKKTECDGGFYEDKDLFFVITIPAFLRMSPGISLITNAAIMAEIESKKVVVITDIDAVSVFYRQSRLKSNTSSNEKNYFIVRAGGTTDIMKHEINKQPTVTSYKDGKSLTDDAFENFLTDMFGKEEFEKFKDTRPAEYLEFRNYLDMKQRSEVEHNDSVRMKLPDYLIDLYGQTKHKWWRKQPKDYKLKGDKLQISFDKFRSFFDAGINLVISDIKLENGNETMNTLLLFGQFAELPAFHRAMEADFPNVKMIWICNSDVLQGAVSIGLLKQSEGITELVPKRVIVAAIDFGTTYSGWAFSKATDFKTDRTKASVKKWHSGSMQTEKTPTYILIRPDGKTIEAFGYDAENRYRDLQDSGEHEQYYFFKHFKMMLHRKLGEKINRKETLEDVMGRSLPALDVFSLSIRFLKDDVLKTTEHQIAGQIQNQDIHWVLTVPAIWTDGAKQFMRESAVQAGIEHKSLTIALEPEAASIYCRHLPIEATVDKREVSISSFKPGTRYLVLDAGGGTIDLTVHEVDSKDGVKEVHAACGGDWGGTMVDEEFENFLKDLVGENVFNRFKKENIEDYLELSRDFEIKKRAIEPSTISPVRFRLPQCLAKAIDESKYTEGIQLKGDKITVSADLSKSFFRRSVDHIVNYVKSTLQDTPVTAILMVGGFSESPMLQKAIRSNFADIEVVIPLEASFSIMKGALIFGHLPKLITKRVLKYTYGICITSPFVEGEHPESKRIQTDTGDHCDDIFDKHVEKDQSVVVGEPQVCKRYYPMFERQKEIWFQVYASETLNPEYTDQNCSLVGELIVDMGDGDLDRSVMVSLAFSDTEITVEATEEKSGKKTYAYIDFLLESHKEEEC